MPREPRITLGNFAKEIHFVILDSDDEHYGFVDSNFLYPPVSGGGTSVHNNLSGIQGGAVGDYQHLASVEVALLHTRLHSITSTSDHSFPGGSTTFLRADGSFASPSGFAPALHADTHQVSGTDQINVVDLSGELADRQKVGISCDPLISSLPPHYNWFHLIPSGSTWVTVADDTVLKKKNITIYSPTGFPTSVDIQKGGISAGIRDTVNFIDGAGITVLPIDNPIADRVDVTVIGHVQQHPITGTADHTSAATAGYMLKADASGLPIQATNTDVQVSAVVSASHTRSHSITGTSDHTFPGDATLYLNGSGSFTTPVNAERYNTSTVEPPGAGRVLFTLPDNFVAGTTRIFLNGLRQKLSSGSPNDYAEVPPNQIQFVVAPILGSNIVADYTLA